MSNSLKVSHIISGDLWAGAEVMAFNLLREMRKLPEIELTIILFNEGRLAKELRILGLPVFIIDEHNMPFFKLIIRTQGLLRKPPPQIIHSHRYKENILSLVVSRFLGRPGLVATQHGMPEGEEKHILSTSNIVSAVNRRIQARCFDRLVVVSESMKDSFIGSLGFFRDRVISIHNGIELPQRSNRRRFKKDMVIGSAGRFFPVKDYQLMVQIAKEASARQSGLLFELAGDGPERPEIEARVSAFGLKSTFFFQGHLVDMGTFYKGLDIYINTSLHEGIPMSILEAMAHGLPVIAPKVGGIPEIIDDGVDGFLVSGREPRDFADKCILLKRNPELRERMGQAARKKVETEFSASAMAQKYVQLYHEVVGGRK